MSALPLLRALPPDALALLLALLAGALAGARFGAGALAALAVLALAGPALAGLVAGEALVGLGRGAGLALAVQGGYALGLAFDAAARRADARLGLARG